MKLRALLWFSIVFCSIALKSYVNGAECGQNDDCTVTKYTTGTCSSKVCGCQSSTVPIRTGCGLKLSTPSITQEAGKTQDFLAGSKGVLTCAAVDGAVSYSWVLKGASTTTLTPTTRSINITEAGTYTCQAISSISIFSSDQSADFIVGPVSANSKFSKAPTVVLGSTDTKIFTGRNVTLTCTGAPLGFDGKTSFLVQSVAQPVFESTTSMTTQLTMQTDYYGKTVTCRLGESHTVTFDDSTASAPLPTEDANIKVTAVEAKVSDANGNLLPVGVNVNYNIGADGPIITCKTTPVPEYLDPSKTLTYVFATSGGTTKQSSNSNTYKVDTKIASDTTYTCSATYQGNTAVTSAATIKITVDSVYVALPELTKEKPEVLAIGSNLVLSCGKTPDATLTYTWLFNDTIIDGQKDTKIQLYNFAEADIGVYKCRATKDYFTTADSSFVATVKPTVTRVPSGTFYGQGGDYVLKCTTGSSVTNGWTYSWKKGDNDLKITTDSYSIKNATAAIHNGSYTCTSTYNGLSGTSKPLPVAVEAAGKRCTTPGDCDTTKGYAGACPTASPQVCTCANYFVLRGEVCGLIKPTISRDPAGTAFYTGTNYVLTCNSGSDNTTGWTYAWKKDDGPVTITTATYNITGANAATHNGSYTCTTTFSTVSSTSDALIVSVVASATAPFINCALMLIMAALGSLFI